MTGTRLDPKVQRQQALRKRRFAMAAATYVVPIGLTCLFWLYDMLPANVLYHVVVYTSVVNIIFFLLFHTNLNLKFPEPSLTALQMTLSIIPGVWAMYFMEQGQARAIFMLFIALPFMYGMLALTIRQFVRVGMCFLFLYLALCFGLWRKSPELLWEPLEFIQAAAFALVIVGSSVIGGYINNLRLKLRERNHRLREALVKIEELAVLDPLTGIYNRRRLFETLSDEADRYNRGTDPFCVCIMDVDHFKQVNDRYGHQAGDAVLREIAAGVSRSLRVTDCFGRYGGEEFLVILPNTSLEGAVAKAEMIRQQVASLRFPGISGDLVVTVSLGVACFREGEEVDNLLARADECLYKAKRAGRNRVETEIVISKVALDSAFAS